MEQTTEPILQFFECGHLPPHLQAIAMSYRNLAVGMVTGADPNVVPLPRNAERTVALRKLLEAKDAAVRAAIAK